MDDLHFHLDARNQFNELHRQQAMARAYIDVTKTLGPSEQLLQFINYDNQLSQEINFGLESLSLNSQHEIVLSKLDPDALGNMGLENLGSRIDNFISFIGKNPELTMIAFGGIAAAVIAAGAIVEAHVNRNKVRTLAYYNALQTNFDTAIAQDEAYLSKLPSTYDESEWKKFYEFVMNAGHVDDSRQHQMASAKMVHYNESGWSPEALKQATQDFMSRNQKMLTLRKKNYVKLASIKSWVAKENYASDAREDTYVQNNQGDSVSATKIVRNKKSDLHFYVSECIHGWFTVFSESQRELNDMHTTLNRVARLFEKKGM